MKSEYQKDIIIKLKIIREKCNYSQAQIADSLGISYGQMGNIESPKQNHKYTLEQINTLCRMFEYPIEKLFLTEEELKEGTDIINKLITNIIRYER